jgi:electron transfer flavoprotein beta subunit
MLAERLSWAQLTFAGSVKVNPDAKSVEITRVTESGVDTITAQFPAVISVIEKINEPRYPSFKGIMAAKKKSIESRSADGLAANISAWSDVVDATPRPARGAGIKVEDGGTGGDALITYLAEKKLV